MSAHPTDAITGGYLPEQPATPAPAPRGRIEIQTTTSVLDYADSWAGVGLTPQRMAQIFRQADWGWPLQMLDMFEHIVLNDGHTRGLFEQRMDEVAGVPWTLSPGDKRPGSAAACELLADALAPLDVAGLVEHIMLGLFNGFSYAEVAWQQRPDGLQVPVELVCVPHRRFRFDQITSVPYLTHETNSYPGVALESRPGSSWVKVETRRWRKPTQAGILRTVTPWVLFKRMSVRDWLIFAEKFGIPMILGKYEETASEATRGALKKAIEALGSEGRAILAHDANIEVLDQAVRAGGGDHLHAGIVQLCNSEISKIITAGTLTSDVGGPGSFALGQVHADGKHKLSLADARRVGAVIQRDIGAEFLRRNGLAKSAAPPWFHVHVAKLSLLTDAQVAKTLQGLGLPLSAGQLREQFAYRAPTGPDDEIKPPETKPDASTDPANPKEPADDPPSE